MLIRCPSCTTAFNVPTSAIGESGRKVKCTKCAHIWFQEPLKQTDLHNFLRIEEKLKPLNSLNSNYNVPATVVPFFTFGKIILLFFVILLFGATSVLAFHKKFKSVETMLMMEESAGLKLKNMSVTKNIVDNKYEFRISGLLVNITDEAKKAPTIDVVVTSKGDRQLDRKKIKLSQDEISPRSQVSINSKVSGISGNANELVISITNPWEKALE